MSTSKHFNKICAMILVFALVLTVCFMNAESFGFSAVLRSMGYEDKIFDPTVVHTIDITMDDWDEFIDNAATETYYDCDMVIDGEAFNDVAIRGKGNTSLTSVENMDSDRYSFKVEFNHYDKTSSYHGLDKLCLNNTIQDKTYMKDFIAYQMMYKFGVSAPLCSFVYITVNGEDWGLYLAVESVEDSFLQRNFGSDTGDLYKPDSQSFGGGRGQGKDFRMSEFIDNYNKEDGDPGNGNTVSADKMPGRSASGNGGRGGMSGPTGDNRGGMNGGFPGSVSSNGDPGRKGGMGGGPGGGMGSSDVKLQYTDDNAESYSNIFNNAKTNVTEADKKRLISSLKSLNEYEDLEEVLDIDKVLRYMVVHNFLVNGDSYTGSMIHNYYLYESDGKLQMIPWDYNLAYGTFQGGDAPAAVNTPIDTPVLSGGFGRNRSASSNSVSSGSASGNSADSGGMPTPPGGGFGGDNGSSSSSAEDRPMVGWIFSSDEYTELYHQYFSKFVEEVLDTGYVTDLIEETAKLIDPYVKSDPTSFYEYSDFVNGWPVLESFIELRTESIRGQLDGTIPSTSEGQKEDSSSLVDTSSLDISAMGDMNDTHNGQGGGPGGGGPGGDFPGGMPEGGFPGGDFPDGDFPAPPGGF